MASAVFGTLHNAETCLCCTTGRSTTLSLNCIWATLTASSLHQLDRGNLSLHQRGNVNCLVGELRLGQLDSFLRLLDRRDLSMAP